MAHVLVVDDEVDFLPLLTTVLARAGHEVVQATSAGQALDQIATTPFDLLIVDNWMPGMTGIEMLREARLRGDRTPAIVMTAYAEVENVVDAMRLGVKEFLLKPFEINRRFVSTVNRCMQ